ncbi:MAG: hypothetical protein II981_01955 [Bacteroidales bacterium]|nr:hypothetical protein [Bacteroidales bacterium]
MNTGDKDIIDALRTKLYWSEKENENLLSALKELQNDNRNLSFKLKVAKIIAAVMSFLTGFLIGLK